LKEARATAGGAPETTTSNKDHAKEGLPGAEAAETVILHALEDANWKLQAGGARTRVCYKTLLNQTPGNGTISGRPHPGRQPASPLASQ